MGVCLPSPPQEWSVPNEYSLSLSVCRGGENSCFYCLYLKCFVLVLIYRYHSAPEYITVILIARLVNTATYRRLWAADGNQKLNIFPHSDVITCYDKSPGIKANVFQSSLQFTSDYRPWLTISVHIVDFKPQN